MKRLAMLGAAALAAALACSTARATNECRGFQVCVPVAGPWVLASSEREVQFQLACPTRFVVAGLDAELSARGIEVAFRGALGSPVNPGITTSSSAVFLARVDRPATAPSFRPHIGCIPASGSGQRYPTAYGPQQPAALAMVQLTVLSGTHRYVERCRAAQRLVSATHAIGFYTLAPPPPAVARSVTVGQTISAGRVLLTVRAGPLPDVVAIVQVDLLCVAAA